MTKVQIPAAFEDLWTPSRYKAFYGGRGSAKSHSVAQALTIMARQRSLRVLCCREIQNSIKDSVKRLLDDKISASQLGGFYQSTDNEIRGANGSLFVFAGLRTNPDSIKSKEGFDIAWVEEAATVSQRSLDLLIPTLRKPGSEIWFTWNPRDPKDPVDKMFRGEQVSDRAIVRRVNWDDNPWFPDDLRKDMLDDRDRDPDKYAHIWLGEYWRSREARVFNNWEIKDFPTPDNVRFYFGGDWGFVDPAVLVRCFIVDRTLYIDREAYKSGCTVEATPALFDKIPGSRQWPIIADSSRPETIDYMKRQGFKIVPSTKGAGSIEDGIEFLKNYNIVVHPSCRYTADELSRYSYETDKLTNEVLPKLKDQHNHVIDALRYAVETLRRARPTRMVNLNVMGR